MKIPRWARNLLIALLVLIGVVLITRQAILVHLRGLSGASAANTILPARMVSTTQPGASAARDESSRPPLSTAARLRVLYRRADFAAAVEAADSDDPAIWWHSLNWSILCMDPRFTKASNIAALPPISGASAAEQKLMRESLDKYRDGPPMRLTLPERYSTLLENVYAKRITSLDPELEKALYDASFASIAPAEAVARRYVIEQTRLMCASYDTEEFLRHYRVAHARWLAAGSTAAMLKNPKAGWTSKQFSELTDADYDLVERIVRERQPDGLARLLSQSIAGSLHMVSETERVESASALMAGLAANQFISAIASCQLGVDDCSPQSPRFRDTCVNFGGCHLDDLAQVMNYILARDGLDPDWINREAERVVKAVWNGDLAALGIRRASEKR